MILLFDFGATRIKSAVILRGTNCLSDQRDSDGGARSSGAEVPAAYFSDVFREHINAHTAHANEPADAIWIASEMHGFILIGERGEALTPYVSWRANLGSGDVTSDKEESVLSTTGLRLRPGLPILNLATLASTGRLPKISSIGGIPEWLVCSAGTWNGSSHLTLAAGTGLVDIRTKTWAPELTRPFADAVTFPTVVDDLARPIGYVQSNSRQVPVYGGVGDLQAALAGLELGPATLSLNLGTGSQVSRVLSEPDRGAAELRPFFDGRYLRTQTHIPAGRALAAFADLFDDISSLSSGRSGTFWRIAGGLTVGDVQQAAMHADLGIFEGAWRFAGGGSITGLLESRMSARDLVASICKSWMSQYLTAGTVVDPAHETRSIALTGGLARRLSWVSPYVEQLFGRPVLPAPFTADETLHGLARLAREITTNA